MVTIVALTLAMRSHFPLPKNFFLFVPTLSNGASRMTSDRKPKTNDQILPSPIFVLPIEKWIKLRQDPPPPPWIEFLAVSYFFIPCERRITTESVDENRLKKVERKVEQTKLRVRRLFDLRKPKSMRPLGCGSKGRDKNRPREIPMGCTLPLACWSAPWSDGLLAAWLYQVAFDWCLSPKERYHLALLVSSSGRLCAPGTLAGGGGGGGSEFVEAELLTKLAQLLIEQGSAARIQCLCTCKTMKTRLANFRESSEVGFFFRTSAEPSLG